MREADRRTIQEIGIPSLVLMENAGRAVVNAIEQCLPESLDGRVAVVCGRGNNGGDGFVVARTLVQQGVDVGVYLLAPAAAVDGDAKANLDILRRLAIGVVEIAEPGEWARRLPEIANATLIVDAIVGTGLRSGLTGLTAVAVGDLNACGVPIVAIDLPSGLSADTPQPVGDCIDASLTVTLAAPKLCLVLPPGEIYTGDLVVADIGIPGSIVDALDGPRIELITPESVRGLVPLRASESHKGHYGRVCLVAGSRGKTGAAYLAAVGALRSGAGLVTVATPETSVAVLAAMAPEFMTEGLDESPDSTVGSSAIAQVLALHADVIACGPGMGRHADVGVVVRGVLERATVPLILDADALTMLGSTSAELAGRDDRPVVVTPHPGEMASLTGLTIDAIQADRIGSATNLASARHLYVVLKGHRTIVATPDGRAFVNVTGNPGMATGGTGDVLAGMIAAWLAQLRDAEAACRLAVYLHGLAGDLAAEKTGEVGLTAGDLASALGDALARLLGKTSQAG